MLALSKSAQLGCQQNVLARALQHHGMTYQVHALTPDMSYLFMIILGSKFGREILASCKQTQLKSKYISGCLRSKNACHGSRLLIELHVVHCTQIVVASERGTLKDVLHNETVELETEMVVAIMKDVASALKYLHQLDPPILDKEITSSGVVLNADYGAQLIHVHLALVRACLLHSVLLQESGSIAC